MNVSSMVLKFHNSFSGQKEIFLPLEPGKVKMYVCGVTPYDACHLGHARCYLFFDVVRRVFKALKFEVIAVQNFTDVDDKIIHKAVSLGVDHKVVADQFIADYFDKMDRLNIMRADLYPRVTEAMDSIIEFVQKLVDSGAAYATAGSVYFRVRNFSGYGLLSKRSLEEMESGARVEPDAAKKDPLDFALWKKAKPNEPFWNSPWGPGRPGWHIECSVMSTLALGATFDLHGGGQDLIFPHHENEIAQSESATRQKFARYWMHNAFVTVNREKMSKSLGNFFTLGDIFNKFEPPVVRLFLLSRHYHSPLDFSDDLLIQAANSYQSIREIIALAEFLLHGGTLAATQEKLPDWEGSFMAALSDDFNTEKALGVLFGLRASMAQKIAEGDLPWLARALATLRYMASDLLGVNFKPAFSPGQIESFKVRLAQRAQFRKDKDWASADKLRLEIEREGFAIEDTPRGAVVKTLRP